MAVALDVSGWTDNHTWAGASSAVCNVTTTASAGIVFVVITYNHHSGTQRNVTGVTAAGLTFVKRKQYKAGNATAQTIEIWAAPFSGGALSALPITVQADGTVETGEIFAAGFTGLHDNTAPFDTNAGLPDTGAQVAGSDLSITYSTTQANDLLLAVFMDNSATVPNSVTAGWSVSAQHQNSAGFLFLGTSIYVRSVSSAQTSQSVATNNLGGGGTPSAGLVDALTADASSNTETGTAALALSGVSFAGSGHRAEAGTGTLALAGASFAASGDRKESGAAVMALSGISFHGAGNVAQEYGTAALALTGVSIEGAAFDVGTPGKGARQLWTF